MVRFLLRALVAALGLWVAHVLGLVHIAGSGRQEIEALVVAGLVLGAVNALVRPIVTILTLPLTIVTLGLFLLVVNALMLLLVSWLTSVLHWPHLSFGSLWHAVLTTIVIWIVSLVANIFIGGDEKLQRR
jgi:putative membrane protein